MQSLDIDLSLAYRVGFKSGWDWGSKAPDTVGLAEWTSFSMLCQATTESN